MANGDVPREPPLLTICNGENHGRQRVCSTGLGQTGAWLGGIGTALAVANGGVGRLLGWGPPPPGGPVSPEMLALTAENATLKAQVYTDAQTRPLAVTQAAQGEQIACIQKQMDLRQQIVEGKIDTVAQVSGMGITALQQAVASVTKLMVPLANIAEPAPAGTVTGG